MTLPPPAAPPKPWRNRVAQAVMVLAAALCWLNAAIIAGNGMLVATQTQAITVSVVVALVYALIGWVQFKMQQHLFRLRALPEEAQQHAALRGLTFFSALFSAGIVLVMLLSLSAIFSRMREGYAIFG
jgi:Ca2+/H+ antiporter